MYLISFFKAPVSNTVPDRDLTLEEIHQMITSPELQSVSAQVRDNPELKTAILPYATPSGTFLSRKAAELKSYSGIIHVDLDKMGDVGPVKEALSRDSFFPPSLIFVSPSGKGLKVFYKLTGAEVQLHSHYFAALSCYFSETYGLSADQACKDIARACLLCSDGNAFYSAENSIPAIKLLSYFPPENHTSVPVFSAPTSTYVPRFSTPTTYGLRPSDHLNQLSEIQSRATAALKSHGWKENGIYWTRPGKVSGTSAIYNIDPRDNLFKFTVFTNNASPFRVKGYTCVQIICELQFGGNFIECITTLAKQYLP